MNLQTVATTALPHKHVIFSLGDAEYGIELSRVRELIGGHQVTPVPSAKPIVRGLVDLRGKVIVVFDMRARFDMPVAPITPRSVIIVVQLVAGDCFLPAGLLVDEVLAVKTTEPHELEPAPELSMGGSSMFSGVTKSEDRIVLLLDVERLLRPDQQAEFRTLVNRLSDEPTPLQEP